jgi:hypothetical protein
VLVLILFVGDVGYIADFSEILSVSIFKAK